MCGDFPKHFMSEWSSPAQQEPKLPLKAAGRAKGTVVDFVGVLPRPFKGALID